MKKLILLSIVAMALVSCKKGQTNPDKPVTTPKDTIPDNAGFTVAIVRDSVVYNESAIIFSHTFHDALVPSEDGSLVGSPYVQFSLLSSDGYILGVDGLPYRPGMVIPTYVRANADCACFIRIKQLVNIPKTIQIWLRDNLLKDSLELHTGNYHFNIKNADTSTFGRHRFQLVIRPE